MIDLNNFQSINLSQFIDSVKFRSGSVSGYHLVIDFCIVMFYMLMILMKLSFIPQIFFQIFTFSSHTQYVKRESIVIVRVKKKNSLLLMNVHVLYVLEDKTSQKNFRLSVWLDVRTYVNFSCGHNNLKELADPNKIWWVSSMYEM